MLSQTTTGNKHHTQSIQPRSAPQEKQQKKTPNHWNGTGFLEVQFETPFYDDMRRLHHLPCQQGNPVPNSVILGLYIFLQLPLTMMTTDFTVV